MTNKHYIIVIDDDQVMRISCLKILKKEGYQVDTFEDGVEGLAGIQNRQPDLLVVDLKMPKLSGMEVIKRVHEIDPDICIVVITGYATIGTAIEAMKAGAYDFLPKPFTPDELRLIVNRGIERHELALKSKQLKKEKEELERRFILFVSHQLQSPLAAVQQYLKVLQHLDDGPEKERLQNEWLDKSLIRLKELSGIIKDWLTILSRIESGDLARLLAPTAIPPIINNILEIYGSLAEQNEIVMRSELKNDLSLVRGNEESLKMLFCNLIHNAIKYNKPKGALRIIGAEGEDFVSISVIDSGIGIAEDKLPLIFNEFYRVKDEATKNISGTGLGLSICEKIVKELGGSIEVISKKNVGTTFTVKLLKAN